MADDDYGQSQQPTGGYLAQAQQGGGYGRQQAPGRSYGPRGQGTSSGGAAPVAQAPKAKTYTLPDPETRWSGHLARYPHVSKLPLYVKGSVSPRYDQVLQQQIANCYLAATLAAMANTATGRAQISKMIVSHTGPMTTTCRKYDSSGPMDPVEHLNSNRWFTVAFNGKTVDVSDVLYHDDSDRDPNLRYMTTPNGDRALWGAIIEVAYARLKNGYDNISASGDASVNQFLRDFTAAKWSILTPAKDASAIKKACQNATHRAAFIATIQSGAKKLIGWHGYTVLGLRGTVVTLWDPLHAQKVTITLDELLPDIQALVKAD